MGTGATIARQIGIPVEGDDAMYSSPDTSHNARWSDKDVIELVGALRGYGEHDLECALNTTDATREGDCDCGLNDLLRKYQSVK